MISIDQKTCADFARSSRLEWLETNGAGGFAMGTVASVNTRRYHGLLVAALQPPIERYLLLSRLDEVVPGKQDLLLATNQYPGTLYPTGYLHLLEFRLDPFPTWVYDVDGARLEKSLFLVQGEQTVVVQYRASRRLRLLVSPVIAFRDYHALTFANDQLDGRVRHQRSATALELHLRPYQALPELHLHASHAATFAQGGEWYHHTEYLRELERGLPFREDLWRAGTLTFDLVADESGFIVATTGARLYDSALVKKLMTAERARRTPGGDQPRLGDREGSALASRGHSTGPNPFGALVASLESAADQFLVRRRDGKPTVIAGYPWFTDWGRDTMISLPGLLIARGRLGEALEVLSGFLAHLNQGLIPNRFPDRSGEPPEYNTVDATLWMFQAAHAWLAAGGDRAFLRDAFYPAAKEILRWHAQGTHHGIRVDPADGLLAAGEQLTWMDARIGDRAITPRAGKAVEINALYYNALRLAAAWGEELGDTQGFAQQADLVERSFERAFWNEARGCLHDVVGPSGVDSSLRPNQLFAVSLPFPLLNLRQRQSIVRVVEAELLTPLGLRTLGRNEPGYSSRYAGDVAARDGAYHQGTVWPWLLGPFVRAYLAAFGRSQGTLDYCRAILEPLERHLSEAGLGTISEIFDAESPHRPGGAPAQAWSVAEPLALLLLELKE